MFILFLISLVICCNIFGVKALKGVMRTQLQQVLNISISFQVGKKCNLGIDFCFPLFIFAIFNSKMIKSSILLPTFFLSFVPPPFFFSLKLRMQFRITTVILSHKKLKQRAKVLAKFMKIAQVCHEIIILMVN